MGGYSFYGMKTGLIGSVDDESLFLSMTRTKEVK
jgi:hypothetical protein